MYCNSFITAIRVLQECYRCQTAIDCSQDGKTALAQAAECGHIGVVTILQDPAGEAPIQNAG
jgi:hypothetical protein